MSTKRKAGAKHVATKRPLSKRRQQAVAIAKDVLKQLGLGRVKLAHYYLGSSRGISGRGPLQKMARTAQQTCGVCAKGALLLSYAHQFNRVDCDDFANEPEAEINKALIPVFGRANLQLIERVFEYWHFSYCSYLLSADEDERIAYFRELAVVDGRLRTTDGRVMAAICRNIIANRGRFVLPQAKAGASS